MRRKSLIVAGACLLGLTIVPAAAAQRGDPAEGRQGRVNPEINVTGTWDILQSGESSPTSARETASGEIKQQWVLEQTGAKVTGKVKDKDGDYSVAGDLIGLNGDILRADVMDGKEKGWYVIATVAGDGMAGTIRKYSNKAERLLIAKRVK